MLKHHHFTIKNHQKEIKALHVRLKFVFGISILLIALLMGRLVQLQVFEHKNYRTQAVQNRLDLIPLPPTRGLIFDRKGELLAENIPVFSLQITPSMVSDLTQTIHELQKIVPINDDEIKIFNKQIKQHRRFDRIPLKLKLSPVEVAKLYVNLYQFPGVHIQARLIRYYPYGSTFAHVLGYVGRINEQEIQHINTSNYSATNFIGKIGVEKFYENQLHGLVGYQEVEVNAANRIIRTLQRVEPIAGKNIYLTIDAKLQEVAMSAMSDACGAVVAIDPNNGEILAMVSYPGYDPNPFVKGIDLQQYRELVHEPNRPLYDRALRGLYPFGSTIKPFVAIAGLEHHVINPTTKIFDPGWYKLPNNHHIYHDWWPGGHGWVDLYTAIVRSCDTYFFGLAHKMGIENLDSMLFSFGFGKKTNVDLYGELTGLVTSPDWKVKTKHVPWYPGDTLNSGIGQGFMLTTPLQLASATATLAMHGQGFQPHLLSKILSGGKSILYRPKALSPVQTSPENWQLVINAMHGVTVEPHGTGYHFFHNTPYTVAGKSGTAQVFTLRHYRKWKESELPEKLRDNHLFIAFAPVESPKIAVAVVVEHSDQAKQIAREVMDAYLLGIKTPQMLHSKILPIPATTI